MLDQAHEFHALIPDAERDACLAELSARMAADEVEVTRPEPGRYEVRDDRLYEDAAGARTYGVVGAALGAAIGIAAGAFVVGLDLGILGIFAFGGAAFGMLIGGVAGLQRNEVLDDDPVRTIDIDDPDGWWVVSVRSDHRAFTGHRLLTHHAAVLLQQPRPISD